MKRIYLIFLIQFFFLSYSSFVKSEISPELKLHENKGCPPNSSCDEKSGKIFLLYDEIIQKLDSDKEKNFPLLKKFIKEHGLLSGVWIKKDQIQKITKQYLGATWDSPQEEIKSFLEEANLFIPTNTPKDNNLFKIPVITEKKETYFYINRDSWPYALDEKLKYLDTHLQLGTNYFTLRYKGQEEVELLKYQVHKNSSQEKIECSPKLLKQFQIFKEREKGREVEKMWKNVSCYKFSLKGPEILIPSF